MQTDHETITLQDIEAAAERVGGTVVNTRFEQSRTLSAILDTDIWLKFENLQFTSSFKERGALNKLLLISETERQQGVIAMSAGNHAKAVAYHAERLGISATIVMPKGTPNIKIEDTERFGANVILEGSSLDESGGFMREIAQQQNLCIVHPYDDPAIIAGQGTVALEMLADNPDLEVLVVPIGGGGLISGIAIAARAIKPAIRIIGVEVQGYGSAYNEFHGRAEQLGGSTIAEGIAVKKPGSLTFPIIKELVDDIVLVSEESIEEAIDRLLTIEKTVTEGAGAAGLAAVASHPELFKGKCTGVVLCGANIDSRILAAVLMRRLIRKGRIVRFRIRIHDLPGILSDITEIVGELGGNILEVSHQRMFSNVPVKDADLYLTVETRDAKQSQMIKARLDELGYAATLLQD
ncbi:MAG: threonine ammonia-lyase [Gammaproteobacteria bacterium]